MKKKTPQNSDAKTFLVNSPSYIAKLLAGFSAFSGIFALFFISSIASSATDISFNFILLLALLATGLMGIAVYYFLQARRLSLSYNKFGLTDHTNLGNNNYGFIPWEKVIDCYLDKSTGRMTLCLDVNNRRSLMDGLNSPMVNQIYTNLQAYDVPIRIDLSSLQDDPKKVFEEIKLAYLMYRNNSVESTPSSELDLEGLDLTDHSHPGEVENHGQEE